MKFSLFLIGCGLILLLLGGFSIWSGKAIGIHGAVETRSSPFYWIIVLTLLGLGAMNLVMGVLSFNK